MTLENLLKIGRLSPLAPNRDDIQRLLDAAKRNLADANVSAVSEESRFDSAYKCIMQCPWQRSVHADIAHPRASLATIKPPSRPCP